MHPLFEINTIDIEMYLLGASQKKRPSGNFKIFIFLLVKQTGHLAILFYFINFFSYLVLTNTLIYFLVIKKNNNKKKKNIVSQT